MTNIAKLLKDAPKGIKLYSPLFGEVKLKYINGSKFGIVVEDSEECYRSFDKYGRYFAVYDNAECLLFPSKGQTWEGWNASKPHYDISNFSAGMPVLVRDNIRNKWLYTLFGMYNETNVAFPFVVVDMRGYAQCIPFNDDTKHLLGTTDPCGEEFINW